MSTLDNRIVWQPSYDKSCLCKRFQNRQNVWVMQESMMHSYDSPFSWNSALNLYVHGSQRANNVTNIKDLAQELSNCFMSQTRINLQGCIQVKFKEGISEMMLGLIQISLPTELWRAERWAACLQKHKTKDNSRCLTLWFVSNFRSCWTATVQQAHMHHQHWMPNQRDKTSFTLTCPFSTRIPTSRSLEPHWYSQ